MTVALSYARILSVREVNDRTLYDIAVKTDAGEVHPGEIEAGGFVIADGLIFGAMVGDEFKPFRMGRSAAGSGVSIRAIVTGIVSLGDGEHEYQFAQARGEARPSTWTEDPDGITGIFYQTLEGGNTQELWSGIGQARLNGFSPVALALGAKVILHAVDDAWYLSSVQAVDGECESVAAIVQGGS